MESDGRTIERSEVEMKTLLVFLSSQMIAWCLGLTSLYLYRAATYPDSFYLAGAASLLLGFYAFAKLNPRINDLTSNKRALALFIILIGMLYIPCIGQLIRVRFQI